MDAHRFLRELPELFERFPDSEHPRDRRFRPVVESIENLASENVLALLNLAAACLDDGESYVEIGVYHGASLVAALMGNEDADIVGIDGFTFREATLEKARDNLGAFGLNPPQILVGDVFELVPGGALGERRVGVWYYDAAHDYASQVEGLRIAEPLLVPGALLIVDDTDWDDVERAMNDYVAAQPRVERVLTLDGKSRGAPQWWEGMQVLRWT